MTFLKSQQAKAREKKTTPWDYYNDIEGVDTYVPLQDIETIINKAIGV